MADNLAVTAGSGTTIGTDDCAGVHIQKVKLVDGTADSTALIAGDATNGLDVDVTRVIPGTSATHLGKAEDAGHSSGDTGVLALSVYRSTPTQGAGTTADYSTINTDQNGRVYTNSALDSSVITAAGLSIAPKFAVIDAATSGDNTLIAAVASNKIRVLSAFLVAAGTVNVRFESGASGTALTGQMNLVVNTGFVLPFNPYGWFETASNTLLNLELSGAVSVDGCISYVEIPA